jgi:hypothetical protein
VEKPDHRHRRLLPARREGPRRSRAAEQRDEIASFYLIEVHLFAVSQGRIAGYRIGEDQSGGDGAILQPRSFLAGAKRQLTPAFSFRQPDG